MVEDSSQQEEDGTSQVNHPAHPEGKWVVMGDGEVVSGDSKHLKTHWFKDRGHTDDWSDMMM